MDTRKSVCTRIAALFICLALTESRGQEEYRNPIPASDTKPGTNTAVVNNFADVTFASLLTEMTDRTVVARWPKIDYRSLQASSTNRRAKTPDDPAGWFANGDCGFAIREETNEGRREAVLMEHAGPGVITRIWTPFFYQKFANRKGTNIRIYIDGESTPRVDTNFIELVTGKGPVKPPFACITVRAGDLYLPIPFGKSCKITQEGGAFFYIINYRAYAPKTKVESFRMPMLDEHRGLLDKTGRELTVATEFEGGKSVGKSVAIASSGSETLALPTGPAAVRHLEFKVHGQQSAQALRSTVVELEFDGESCVWCPLGDFFSNVNSIDPHAMWERQVKADGTMICRWVMPYQKSATLRLHNFATTPVQLDVKAVVAPWDWDENSLHFRTNWWTDEPYPPRPVRDMNFIDIKGRGIHVGDTLVVLNPLWSWWGEGDEKIYVDEDLDRRFPSHFGTGSEDYYGWAGGVVPTRKDEFSTPFVANVRVGGETRDWPQGKEPYTHGYNICTRTRSLDATPFTKHFKFDMEAFNMIGSPDAYLQYALVTHWYGAPGAEHNRPPLPEAAAAPVPQTSDVAAFSRRQVRPAEYHIKGAIELEDVGETVLSPGLKAGRQVIGDALAPHRWSNASQFLASAVKPGDSATFTLLEQYQPKRIKLYPTVSHDYGIVNILVNDRLAVEKWNGYSKSPQPAKPLDLGEHKPDGNVIRLKIEVTGKDGKSSGHFFGFDAVVLEDAGQ